MKQFAWALPACIAECVLSFAGCNAPTEPPEQISHTTATTETPALQSTVVRDNPDPPGVVLKAYDLASLIGSGAITADHNTGWNNFPRKLTDGDTGTFKTTNGVDPVVLTFRFQQPTTVKSVRLFVSGATQYDWTVRTGNNGAAFWIKGAGPEQWSRIDLPEPAMTQSLVLELSRPGSDHTVSVHELEVYGPGS